MIPGNPVRVHFGNHISEEILSNIGERKALLVCSHSARARYTSNSPVGDLLQSPQILFEHTYSENPSLEEVSNLVQKYVDQSIEVIIGLGGGSAMDVAKTASVALPALSHGLLLDTILDTPAALNGVKALNCILVPTTAGTGSEVTPFATIWDYDSGVKKSLSSPEVFASEAYVDPYFLSTLPFNVAVSTGLDALNQAFESIWNRNATPTSLKNANHAARLGLRSLPLIAELAENETVRNDMALASVFAGGAIAETKTSICHSISYPLTISLGIPHGLACAFSMRDVLHFNLDEIEDRLSPSIKSLDLSVAGQLDQIFEALDVDAYLKSYISHDEAVMDLIPSMIWQGRFDNNIKHCSQVSLEDIIRKSLKRLS